MKLNITKWQRELILMMTRCLIPTNPDLAGMVTIEGMGKGGQLRMEATTDRAAIMLTIRNVTMSNL